VDYKPILLFDDIFDKLDPARVQQIIELVGRDSFGQVFIHRYGAGAYPSLVQ
jgi:recombinational DNA repair ATPase RecF